MISRAAVLQIFPHQRLSQLKSKQFKKTVTLNSRRGAILDRNGKELAVTVPSYSLFADPTLITNPVKLSRSMALKLKMNRNEIYKKLNRENTQFVWIKRNLNKRQREEIQSLGSRGLGFIEEPKRIYPAESLLSHTIGFIGREGRGLEGLELRYDKWLSGEKKRVNVLRDARGRPLLVDAKNFSSVPDGSSLVLTIDMDFQYALEKELNRVVEEFEADGAVGVIMDARTSEVLALANDNGFDLNSPFRVSSKVRRNRALTDSYEPGSVMKPFVVAGAIREGLVKPNTNIDCEKGRFKIGDRWVREADRRHVFDKLTVSEVIAKSSNVGTTKIALKMGSRKLRKTLVDFGFGSKTGVGFPGEAAGILHKAPWRPHKLSNVSFGHALATSPLQVASAYAAIANGGVLKKPLLVKRIVNEEKGEEKEFRPEVVRRVLSKEEANTMRMILMAATSKRSTGYAARVPGYLVAGKTGTAQKVSAQGGYEKGAYISSFAGFLPAHSPRFVIYIAVDHPRESYYGSEVAAPAFARLGKYAVRKSGLPPMIVEESHLVKAGGNQHRALRSLIGTKSHPKIEPGVMPDLEGLSLRQALVVLKKYRGLDVQVRGSGRVVRTFPAAGEKLPKENRVRLSLKSKAL
jgi:cell division protein FtsI (penicillin-binding protein 3)